MKPKLSIKIKIGDRDYSMQTDNELESKLRMAGQMINHKVKYYQKNLGVEDRYDLLAMSAFDCMVELINLRETLENQDNLLKNRLQNLEELVINILEEKEL